MTPRLDLCPAPRQGGEGSDGSRQLGDDMIGPAGTVGLHVTSIQGEAAVGRGGGGGKVQAQHCLTNC